MEGVRPSLVAALLFVLTLVVLAASASDGSGTDDAVAAADAVEVEEHPLLSDDEPYMLVAFHNKDGEEIRLLADKLASSGFANRSGHWFYRRRLPKPNNGTPSSRGSRTEPEGFWNTLETLANYTAASGDDLDPAADDDDEQGYMLLGMETSGGDKIRVVVVACQRYLFITGFAKGWFRPPNWFFRGDGERHRLLTTLGSNGSSSSYGGGSISSSSHAEVVASNVLAAMMNDGKA